MSSDLPVARRAAAGAPAVTATDPPVIECVGVRKTFRIGVGRARVREMIPPPIDASLARMFPAWWWKDTFEAIAGVTFAVERGDALGLVGHNGAGKTTLLKILAGVMEPTAGHSVVRGRFAALIDVLVGFNGALTGRENVYVLGALYGYTRKQMDARMDRIFEFSEIDEMMDTPVKRFSAGMGARLGFALITALDFDVLMIDEVLAVGDAAFQRKCLRWLETFREGGGTLLFVSHNMALVRSMTDRVVWLDHGAVVMDGPTPEVLRDYGRAMEQRGGRGGGAALSARERRKRRKALGPRRYGAGGAWVEEVHVGEAPTNGEPLSVRIAYESEELREGSFTVGFIDEAGRELGSAASPMLPLAERGVVTCDIRPLPLRDGIYFPFVAIVSDGRVRDRWRLDRAMVVDRGSVAEGHFGPVELAGDWRAG